MSKKVIHSETIFVDSGAHSIYNIEVLKSKKKQGKHGKTLDKPPVAWGGSDPKTDYSYFDLTKGSPFRKYCDDYAAFIKHVQPKGVICANVDAISNPELTWQIQRFFEEEHGVQPVPIVHCYTPMGYVDRYLEAGKYDLMGVGGLGQGISKHEYFTWGDQFFRHICPKSNKYLPVIKTHGFAMTSLQLMIRWPWWSVDSATWVKLSAYGWIYIPRWSRSKGFRFDLTPRTINFSFRSPQKKISKKHYDNYLKSFPEAKVDVDKWMERLGIGLGSVDQEGNTVEFGLTSHHRARSVANLTYLSDLQDSLPPWPHPLDNRIVCPPSRAYWKGLGL